MNKVSTKNGYYTNLSYAPMGSKPTAWQVANRPESGTFIQTLGGVPLCRVGGGCVYFWDKQARAEVCISVEQLRQIAG